MLKYLIGGSRMSIRNNRFALNKDKARILGVCAGLADYLEAPVFLIRIITVLTFFAWPTFIIVYFCTYWWLKSKDDSDHSDPMFRYVSGSRTANHFRKINYKRPLYRNTRMARIAGICAGIADYLEIRVRLVRLAAILSFFFLGPFVFFAYCACWIALDCQPQGHVGFNEERANGRTEKRRQRRDKKRQRHAYRTAGPQHDPLYETQSDDPLYDPQYQNSNSAEEPFDDAPESEEQINDSIAMSVQECSAAFNKIETRLRSVEAFMTSRRFRLHCEINRI